jgi:hypothetical protein
VVSCSWNSKTQEKRNQKDKAPFENVEVVSCFVKVSFLKILKILNLDIKDQWQFSLVIESLLGKRNRHHDEDEQIYVFRPPSSSHGSAFRETACHSCIEEKD